MKKIIIALVLLTIIVVSVFIGGNLMTKKDNKNSKTEIPNTITPLISITPILTPYPTTEATPLETKKPITNIDEAVSRLKIQNKASNIFIVIQDKDSVKCDFYAYTKVNDVWVKQFYTKGYVGRNGIINEGKKEGDGFTPSGVFTFGKCFGINNKPDNVPMGYTKVTNEDYWDSNPESDTYNEWVRESELPIGFDKRKYEHLISYKGSYNYVASINYNVNPIIKGNGSAIFLHCTREGSIATAGCVAIPESYMIKALSMIYTDTYIVICRSFNNLLKHTD